MDFDPAGTPQGKLPPWDVVKPVAFQEVISKMEKHLGKTCKQLTGLGKADFTAEQLTVVGGWESTGRAVQLTWTKVKEDEDWFPFQPYSLVISYVRLYFLHEFLLTNRVLASSDVNSFVKQGQRRLRNPRLMRTRFEIW